MKQALKTLEYPLITSHEAFDVDMAELLAHRAIESLRQAIAEAEKQEPIAEVISTNEHQAIITWQGTPLPSGSALYTHPQPQE